MLWPFFLYLPLLFIAMTFIFTFPGTRGGLFHSGGALLPVVFATAGPGLEAVLLGRRGDCGVGMPVLLGECSPSGWLDLPH